MTEAAKVCGAAIHRCKQCSKAVSPSKVRAGERCPTHPDAEVVDGTCEKPVKSVATRCKFHGGNLMKSKIAAAQRQLEADVNRQLEVAGWEPVDDPITALADLMGEVIATKDAFGARVAELRNLTVEDQVGRQDVAPLLGAYERALDRCTTVLLGTARLNLEERLVRVRERQQAKVVDAISRTVAAAELGLSPEAQTLARTLIAKELRT